MKQFLISIFILSLFTSCGLFVKKVSFTDKELEWFNVYNVNDTLVFKSLLSNKRDTSIITYKNINYHYNPIVTSEKTQCVNLTYINKNFEYTDNQIKTETLIFSCKNSLNDEEQYHLSFNYLRSSFILDENTIIKPSVTLTLLNKSFNNVYELVYKRLKVHGGTNDDPEILYWDKKHGIIKYISFNGEVWERINWKN